MHRTLVICALTGALGVAASAWAQQIEISSQSIGTVVVTPPPINPTGPRPAAARAGRGNGNGVDLGIRRNRDGSLYDALDPAQNPAAAPAPDTAAANQRGGEPAGALNGAQAGGNATIATPAPLPAAASGAGGIVR